MTAGLDAHRLRLGQLVRYGAVSVIASLTSMVVLGVLVATRTATPGWANVIATAVGTVPSFELNRRWVWDRADERRVVGQVTPFAVLSFAGLAISTAAVSLAGHWATTAALGPTARTLAVEAANVAAFGSLWIAQFLILDRVLFGRRPAARPIPAPSPAVVAIEAGVDTRRPEPVGSAA